MLKLEKNVGQLILIKVDGTISAPEVKPFRSEFAGLLVRLGRKFTLASDCRGCLPMSDDVYAMMLGIFRSDTPLVRRSAHLVTAGTTFAQQLAKIIEGSGTAPRRIFTTAAELLQWIDDDLEPTEREAAQSFYAAHP